MRARLQVAICFLASLLPWGGAIASSPKPTYQDTAICVCTNGVAGWAEAGTYHLVPNMDYRPDTDDDWALPSHYDDITIFRALHFQAPRSPYWPAIYVVCAHTNKYGSEADDFNIIWGSGIGAWDGQSAQARKRATIYLDDIRSRCIGKGNWMLVEQ